jgi:hypothetical protein
MRTDGLWALTEEMYSQPTKINMSISKQCH